LPRQWSHGPPSLQQQEATKDKESAIPIPKPVSRFFTALYKGVTSPFPILRKIAFESSKDKSGETKQVGFSLKEALVAMAVYLSLGAISYHSTVVGNQWSFVDAFYFSVVTFTTVGYGDLCPTTVFGKVFTMLFGLAGISILGVAISTLGSRLAEMEEGMVKKARKASRHRIKSIMNKVAHGKGKKGASTLSVGEVAASLKKTNSATSVPLWRQTLKSLLTKSVPAFAVIILGGIVMGRVEGWSLMDSVYYAFITGATLGYGDFSPVSKTGRLFGLVFIPLSVAAAGEVLGNVATTLQERRQELYYESIMKRELNVDRLLKMDLDHDGHVSREEYCEFMLKEMGLVTDEEFQELHDQFARLDRDGSGLLDRNDLQEKIVVTQEQEESEFEI
jgi:potassium channel subfamily K